MATEDLVRRVGGVAAWLSKRGHLSTRILVEKVYERDCAVSSKNGEREISRKSKYREVIVQTADTVFLNGQVITVDPDDSIEEALAVGGHRILAVGSDEKIRQFIGDSTQTVDLAGRSLLPGIVDAHMHLLVYGTNMLGVNCKQPHMETLDDVFDELRQKCEQTEPGEWVRASGFNNTTIAEERYPTRGELDEVSTKHPILVVRTCGHISIANSLALEHAGVDRDTEDPEGGRISRNEDGEPNGLLVEAAHMSAFETASFTEPEYRQALRIASEDFIAAGVTSVHDAGGYGPHNLRIMQQAVAEGDVRLRVYAIVCSLNNSETTVDKAIEAGMVTGLGDERFKIGPAKVFTDGSSSGPTVATREPYTSDPEDYGILYYEQEKLNSILGRAHDLGFQITAHAQGDRAIEMLINCIEESLRRSPREDHRHRIEHSGITPPDLLERIRKLGIIPIPNPAFCYEFGDGYLRDYGDRVDHMFPARDFLDAGVMAAGGSDSPVTDYNPLLGIHTAVNRKSSSGTEVGADQRIGLLEAIRLFTYNGAHASFEEDEKGSLETGKLADLVVLSEPLLSVEQEKIKDVQVDATFVDGKEVFARHPARV